jgi:transposase
MPAPYSYDLRKKAVNAYYRGEKKIGICRLMKISRNTLDQWLERERETGDCQVNTNRPTRENRKIQDWQRFKQFVKQHKDKTQLQMADLWGENLTQQNVSDGIKKLGITRKKNLRISRKRRREKTRMERETFAKTVKQFSLC